jgi:hypothetical protein
MVKVSLKNLKLERRGPYDGREDSKEREDCSWSSYMCGK